MNSGNSPSLPPRPGSEYRRRRRVRFKTGAPYLVPLLAAAAVAAAAWHWRAEIQDYGSSVTLQSPETQIKQALAAQGRAHLEDIYGWKAGGTLELVPVRYSEVVPDVEGNRATVVAVLDAEGKAVWRDQEARVSYVGREQFHMKPCKIALWCAEGDQFARLRAVLRTLFRRLDAARAGDAATIATLAADDYQDGPTDRAALVEKLRQENVRHRPEHRPDLEVKAWQIRVDRDGAEVGEDYDVNEGGNVRHRRARYRLERRGERWVFVSGL